MPATTTRSVPGQLHQALNALRRTTGVEGRVLRKEPRGRHGNTADALVEFTRDRRKHRVAVLAKTVDRVEALWPIKERFKRLALPALLFAPYITRTIAQKCRELDIPFIDTAGNAYLRLPGILVFVTGERPVDGARAKLQFRGLGTATALRMVFGLLCRPEMVTATYRDIAATTGVALGAVGPVFRDLRERGYLAGGRKTGGRRLLEPRRLFEEWVTNYPAKLRPKLNPRRLRAPNPQWWANADIGTVKGLWGGEVAARRLTKHLKPATVTLYVAPGPKHRLTPLVARHKLRADPEGEIEVLDRFWTFETDPEMPDLVPPMLVYADLAATLDARNLEVAEMIRERFLDDAFRKSR